jgi:hypothetical protein
MLSYPIKMADRLGHMVLNPVSAQSRLRSNFFVAESIEATRQKYRSSFGIETAQGLLHSVNLIPSLELPHRVVTCNRNVVD